MELAFFKTTPTVLCFGLVAQTALITPQHFGHSLRVLAQHQDFPHTFCPPLASSIVDWRWARSWEGTQLRQLTQTDQRDIPYNMTCSKIKSRLKKEEEGMVSVFVFQVPMTCDGSG